MDETLIDASMTKQALEDCACHEGHSSARRQYYNILMIAPTTFFSDYGCHVRILEEASILRELGNRITICTYHRGRDVNGLAVERIRSLPWGRGYKMGSSWHKIAFDGLLSLKVFSLMRRWRPDLIHAYLHEGVLISYPFSRLWGIPLVFDFQGSLTGEMIDHQFLPPDGLLYRPLRWLEEVINDLPQAIITSSRHAAALLEEEFGCSCDHIYTVPDGVDTERFKLRGNADDINRLKTLLGLPRGRKMVIYLGLLAGYQGLDLLLQAAVHLLKRRSNVHFLIMGYPRVERYQAMALRLGLAGHMTFTGRIPYEEAHRYLALGDLAVAPKISLTESNGKLLNYMAMALPTVAFDTPVNREYLSRWGVYAPWGDPQALAEAIESLLMDEERAATLGQALRERAIEEYSWERAGKKIMAVYDAVLSGK